MERVKLADAPSRVHGTNSLPATMPFVVPLISTARPTRLPVMRIDCFTDTWGVTLSEGSDAAPQPAPLRARTVKVYAVPLARPETVHDVVVVKHIRPLGDEVTWYVDTPKEPEFSGAAQLTTADASAATAETRRGAPGATAGGGDGGTCGAPGVITTGAGGVPPPVEFTALRSIEYVVLVVSPDTTSGDAVPPPSVRGFQLPPAFSEYS